jgi:adsorption protein B
VTDAILLHYVHSLSFLTVVVAIGLALSAADDLFVDGWFWARELFRRIKIHPHHPRLRPVDLHGRAEQPFAIMVPAWKEDDVIAQMIENAVREIDYANYVIFVGTYINDQETIFEVERMRRRYRRVIRVEVPHGGPTCKADCLNNIVAAIRKYEVENGLTFAGSVLHDAEDVIHPLELKYFNYIVPRKDLIQLPVVSLERRYRDLVAGVYMDEFAEWHAKDLVVRESLGRSVPSAGVGTCFSHLAMRTLSEQHPDAPFNTASLTEDYDIGARLTAAGLTSMLARFDVPFQVKRRRFFGLVAPRTVEVHMPLCVREYFPNKFRHSYRQKARWTLGISLQGWEQLGWSSSWRENYFLYRDRKSLFSPTIQILSYIVLLNFLILLLLSMGSIALQALPQEKWFEVLLGFNAVALILRTSQRIYFVSGIYGWEHGVLSVPRTIVGSLINFTATARAIKLFVISKITGIPAVWDKTTHEFPKREELAQERLMLGEILLEWGSLEESGLDRALTKQAGEKRPLGEVLLEEGLVDEETLADALAVQNEMARTFLTGEKVAASTTLMPAETMLAYGVLAIGRNDVGSMILAVKGPVAKGAADELADQLGGAPMFTIVRATEFDAAMNDLRLKNAANDHSAPATSRPSFA